MGERIRLTSRDSALAGALALLVAVLYAATWQTRFYGDGPGLASFHVLGTGQSYYNVLFLRVCRAAGWLTGGGDPFLAPRLVSIVPAALGAGLCFLNSRLMGASVFGSLAALGLLVLSPALWFFGTTIEIHALLFGVVELATFVTLVAPWRRPWLALGLVALVFPLLFWAHQASFTLGLGWVFLVQYARAHHGTRFTWPQLFLGVGPVLLCSLLAAVAGSYWMRFDSLEPLVREVREQMSLQDVQGGAGFLYGRPVWRDEWIAPLGLLLPLAAFGLWRRRHERLLALALLALLSVPTAFFLWWGVFENGGYFLGSDAFLLPPLALLLGRASVRSLVLVVPLLVAQGWLARARIDDYDRGWVPLERVEQVRRAVGEHGLLISTVELAPEIRCTLPDVKDLSMTTVIRNACTLARAVVPPEQILAMVLPQIERLRAKHGRAALETGYRHVSAEDHPNTKISRPILEALEAELRARYAVTELPHADWSMLVLEPR